MSSLIHSLQRGESCPHATDPMRLKRESEHKGADACHRARGASRTKKPFIPDYSMCPLNPPCNEMAQSLLSSFRHSSKILRSHSTPTVPTKPFSCCPMPTRILQDQTILSIFQGQIRLALGSLPRTLCFLKFYGYAMYTALPLSFIKVIYDSKIVL